MTVWRSWPNYTESGDPVTKQLASTLQQEDRQLQVEPNTREYSRRLDDEAVQQQFHAATAAEDTMHQREALARMAEVKAAEQIAVMLAQRRKMLVG